MVIKSAADKLSKRVTVSCVVRITGVYRGPPT